MKVKLLKTGGYPSLLGLTFPLEVDAYFDDDVPDGSAIYVLCADLVAVGANPNICYGSGETRYFIDDEFEVVK